MKAEYGRYVRVRAEVWIDVAAMFDNERDLGFDLSGDPKWDAEYLVRCGVDSLTGIAGLRVSTTVARTLPDD